jgi:glucosamine-6-phosphate deaminase
VSFLEMRRYDQLAVAIYDSARESGEAAAQDLTHILRAALFQSQVTSIILASAPSQDHFMTALRKSGGVNWSRIAIFHMDEYVGMPETHRASLRRYIREQLTDTIRPRAFYGIAGDATDLDGEMIRYSDLLTKEKPIGCILGIGENGHLAFNEPPAQFDTQRAIQLVTLADASQRQQVAEGHFESIGSVPRTALTLTIPTLLQPRHVLAVVPERRKARAVRTALEGPISGECPASVLRTVTNARLYLDGDSASELT